MSSSSNTQGNDTTRVKRRWYQYLIWNKKFDLQNTPVWRQIFEALPVLIGLVAALIAFIAAFFFSNVEVFFYLLWRVLLVIAVLWVAGKILDWFQERGFGNVINDETDKVDSRVHPERFEERPAPKKAGAPSAPASKPAQRQTPATKPQPAAQAKPGTSQQSSSRPGKGNARRTQQTNASSSGTAHRPGPTNTAKEHARKAKPGTESSVHSMVFSTERSRRSS